LILSITISRTTRGNILFICTSHISWRYIITGLNICSIGWWNNICSGLNSWESFLEPSTRDQIWRSGRKRKTGIRHCSKKYLQAWNYGHDSVSCGTKHVHFIWKCNMHNKFKDFTMFEFQTSHSQNPWFFIIITGHKLEQLFSFHTWKLEPSETIKNKK